MRKIAIIAAVLVACIFGASHDSPAKSANPAGTGRAFSGRVVQVNVVTDTLFVREGGNTVGFDVSSPVFSGYSSLSAVRVGDRVAVSYIPEGTRIARLSRGAAPAVEEKLRSVGQPAIQRNSGKRQTGLIKRGKNLDTTGFTEADVNRDGKITPVGLSVVIKDVTMDEFRQYDKSHKGYLSKAEFLQAVRDLRARGK
jgi:hypothetical protein